MPPSSSRANRFAISLSPPWPGRKRGTESQAVGRSRGGLTTKVLALTDASGNLLRFVLLPRGNAKRLPLGQRHGTVGVAPLIQDVKFDALIADKAFDANWIIDELDERGAKIVISQMPQRKAPLDIDRKVYKWRHLIENLFRKLLKGRVSEHTEATHIRTAGRPTG